MKENQRRSTCNWLGLQTLRSQLVMPKNLPDHCSFVSALTYGKSLVSSPIRIEVVLGFFLPHKTKIIASFWVSSSLEKLIRTRLNQQSPSRYDLFFNQCMAGIYLTRFFLVTLVFVISIHVVYSTGSSVISGSFPLFIALHHCSHLWALCLLLWPSRLVCHTGWP